MTDLPWWKGLTGRQWLVLLIAWMGWVFDIMDVFLLVLAKDPAMRELLGPARAAEVGWYSSLSLTVTLVGWAAGGLIFGMVADRWGRTRTMALTILLYSVFTGLMGFARNWEEFIVLRFLAALGIGGEWGTGASMLAEVFPRRARAVAAGLLQAASGAGFFAATLLWEIVDGNWRHAFMAGALPAMLALFVRLWLREPQAWVAARQRAGKALNERMGSLAELFRDRELRRRTLVATGVAVLGICGYWSTMFWFPESLGQLLKSLALPADQAKALRFRASMLVNTGALLGFLVYIPITQAIGRKKAFFLFHVGSLISVPLAFKLPSTYWTWIALFSTAMFFTNGVFSGYTIQFPELYPTRLRATGASFCYNVGRVVAAPGPLLKVSFISLFGSIATASAAMAALYGVALLLIPLLPETRGVILDAEAESAPPP